MSGYLRLPSFLINSGSTNVFQETFEAEPICKVLPIAPYTYHLRKAQQRDITLLSPRAWHDIALKEAIMRIHEENYNVYGARANGTSFSLTYNQIVESFFDTANEEQEQLIISANQELPSNWAIKLAQEYDMIDNRRELIDSSIELTFVRGIQDCLNISIGYNRDATRDCYIKPADAIYFTLTFKYLGSTSSGECGS